MSSFVLTGADTIIINDEVIADLANGTVATLEFDTDIATATIGKDGNAILAPNAQGDQGVLTLRLPLAGYSDRRLNGLMSQQKANFVNTVTLTGGLFKKVGDGQGNVQTVSYSCSGGFFQRNISAQSNVEGDGEQGVAVYQILFTSCKRSIG